MKTGKETNSALPAISLIREGAKIINKPLRRRPLLFGDALRCTDDWEFIFDLDDSDYVFPIGITVTRLRPDAVIFSKSLKTVLLIELTCPIEDRLSVAHDLKLDRYAGLLTKCEENGWKAHHFPVEVGSRGFVSFTVKTCLSNLGMSPSQIKKVRQEVSRTALRASYMIYLRRQIPQWGNVSPVN